MTCDEPRSIKWRFLDSSVRIRTADSLAENSSATLIAMGNELLTRAVQEVMPRELAEKKLASGKKLRLYLGIDPTGSKLHLGHSVPLLKLKAFAEAGHHVIFLVGDGTAVVGDPTGRNEMRPMLMKEEIKKNFETYKEQAEKILDFDTVELRYNSEWLEKMDLKEVMDLARHFTVQQMMQRDMFRERMRWKVVCTNCNEKFNSPITLSDESEMEAELEGATATCPHCDQQVKLTKDNVFPPENPVSPSEFLYPLMQGYDSVMLDVDFEVGGSDQLFNILCGRKLQKVYGKREKCALTTRLIEGTDGRKMSKTYENCVYLTDEPEDMFGKIMSINDDLIPVYMECCTEISMEEVQAAAKALQDNSVHPKELKVQLAKEIVTLYHSADAAEAAAEEFQNIFKDKGVPDDVPEVSVEKGSGVIDVMIENGFAASKSEAKRLVEQGGVKMNDVVVDSVEAQVEEGILKVGKRKFLKVNF